MYNKTHPMYNKAHIHQFKHFGVEICLTDGYSPKKVGAYEPCPRRI